MVTRIQAATASLEQKIKATWLQLSRHRGKPVTLRLSVDGREISGFGERQREKKAFVIGAYDSRVSLEQLREDVFHVFDRLPCWAGRRQR